MDTKIRVSMRGVSEQAFWEPLRRRTIPGIRDASGCKAGYGKAMCPPFITSFVRHRSSFIAQN